MQLDVVTMQESTIILYSYNKDKNTWVAQLSIPGIDDNGQQRHPHYWHQLFYLQRLIIINNTTKYYYNRGKIRWINLIYLNVIKEGHSRNKQIIWGKKRKRKEKK